MQGTEYTLNMLIESELDPDKTRRYLLGGNVDGALVVSHHTGDHSFAHLSRSLPLVFGGRPLDPEESSGYTVDVDNEHGAAAAAQHLVDAGRTRIATIAGPQDMPPGVDRLNGFTSVVTRAGLAADLVADPSADLAVPGPRLETGAPPLASGGVERAGRPVDQSVTPPAGHAKKLSLPCGRSGHMCGYS